MFIGRHYHKLEDKGRVSLPKKYREVETDWVVTRGLDGGLFVFRKIDFLEKIEEIAQRSFTKKRNRDFVRLMVNEAQEVAADANGRISLPEYLISLATLTKDVVIVGSYNYLEIWDMNKYHQYLDSLEKNSQAIAESIEDEK
jgi:MraZ protein